MAKTDIARRVYNHTCWKLDPIIRSPFRYRFLQASDAVDDLGMYPGRRHLR